MEKVSISGKETKIHIRVALKAVFPSAKFSLTSDYNTVQICWTDGPTAPDVEKVLNRFVSYTRVLARDDHHKATGYEWDGVIYVGARYLNAVRRLSDERKQAIVTYMDASEEQSFANANVSERVQAESKMIAEGLLQGVPPLDLPHLMRDEPPVIDQRPKRQERNPFFADMFKGVQPTEVIPSEEKKSLNNVVEFPQKLMKRKLVDSPTPEQQLKMLVLESLSKQKFFQETEMTVDEAFAYVANELYADHRGK